MTSRDEARDPLIVKDLVPSAEDAPEEHGFAQVIGVVIGHKQSLAQDGLTVPVRNFGEQINGLIRHQLAHGLEIRAKGLETPVPRRFVGRCRRAGPIALRKIRRFVLWVTRELEDVPLGDAQVLEDFPSRVLCAFGPLAAKFDGKVLEDGVELRVGVPALEET